MSDCDFCRNATTCEELSHDNDLSYSPCGDTLAYGLRMLFRAGDNKPTTLLVEWHGRYGWEAIAKFTPNYCPFCGRPLAENYTQRRNKNV